MCEGDHDTMLRMESLAPYRSKIELMCEKLLLFEKPDENYLNLS